MRKIFIYGIGVSLILAVTVFFILQSNRKPITHSEDQLLSAITKDVPLFLNNSEPTIMIDNIYIDKGWYVVTLKSSTRVSAPVPVKVAIYTVDSEPRVVFGPSTHFLESAFLSYSMPETIKRELVR